MSAGTKRYRKTRPGRRREKGAQARAWIFLAQERLSVSELALKLGVSRITAKRTVQRLRRERHEILSVRSGKEFYYELRHVSPWTELERDPLLTTVVPAGQGRVSRGKPEDIDYDAD